MKLLTWNLPLISGKRHCCWSNVTTLTVGAFYSTEKRHSWRWPNLNGLSRNTTAFSRFLVQPPYPGSRMHLVLTRISYAVDLSLSCKVSSGFLQCHWLSLKGFISNQMSHSGLVFVSTLCCIPGLWDALHFAFALFRETGFTASEQCDKPG